MKKDIGKKAWIIFLMFLGMAYITLSCSKDKEPSHGKEIRKEYRIAVVLPFSGDLQESWENCVEWALENLNTALEDQRQIQIIAEWYDEEKSDMEVLFADLARRDDISAIIGPLYSANARIAAEQCSRTGKTLITGTVSSELVMRTFAGKQFLWCLAENDISQCEVLLTRALQKNAKSVSLLTSDDAYGTTFWDWFSFQAKELGLEVKSMEKYTPEDITQKMRSLLEEEVDCVICIPSENSITLRMNEVRTTSKKEKPFLLFSDVAFLSGTDATFEGMEGIVLTHDPTTGFHIAYEVRFGEEPKYGSAHYYDAVILAGLGVLEADLAKETTINKALCRIVDGEGENICANSAENVSRLVSTMINGEYPRLSGVSGKLRFDKSVYTNVLHSVYCHWVVYNGKHLILEYNTSDDNNRTTSYAANWNWKATLMQDFSNSSGFNYPDKTDLYALIIAASSGWDNYRHQSDAYAMYQQLKVNGLDDDHILLIAEDDIAMHSNNPYPGAVYTNANGLNVYENIQIDYKLSSFDFNSLYQALTAEGCGFLPKNTDNLLVYWVGHGTPEGPVWEDKIVSASDVANLFRKLSDESRYRKVLLTMETCFSGQVGLQCEGIPGLLCIAAANDLETSKVSRYSTSLGAWMSNSFTDALLDQYSSQPDQSFYKLYSTIYNRTIGSHVSVYNASAFDNLYSSSIREFLYP